jgi:uronate dehydrogenase
VSRPVLVTGASGALGSMLAGHLAEVGWDLVLTDIKPFPRDLPKHARFALADLCDRAAIAALAEGCGAIVHFGGVSTERPFEEVLGPNIAGLFHIYEAARLAGARVIFASSNHAIGFHERSTTLDADCELRPDTYYGLSKAYGELMGRMYWDKHGVENINLRIGSCFPKPIDRRMLSTWLSYDDLTRLCERCVLAERAGHAVIWACSDNPASYWGRDHRDRIGWAPQDSAEPWRAEVAHITADPVSERYQGGGFTAMEYSRARPSAADPFALDD